MSRARLAPRAPRLAIRGAVAGTAFAFGACSDPAEPDGPASDDAREMLARYVSLGTSNTQGVQSAGVFAAAQRAAWSAQLAERAGVSFVLPLVQDPGCGPPLRPPLAASLELVRTFGDDLVTASMSVCAPLQPGVTLPANNVAIAGATARTALRSTPELELARNPRAGELYRRVLPSGYTQVTAMLAQDPTFVSVELGANEVLAARTGRIAAMTPYDDWVRDYDEIIVAVRSTGARGVLVGLPARAANFPSIRRATELFDERAFLRTLRVEVGAECSRSTNLVFLPGYLLTLMAAAPTTATCADVPGAVDYVLTPDDISAIDARMARMNAHIQARASENGYAYFSLEALYGLPKPRLSLTDVMFSSAPFGSTISLDGVHPNDEGQAILATAAARAIGARYGVTIP